MSTFRLNNTVDLYPMILRLDLRVITKGHSEVEYVGEWSVDRDGGSKRVAEYLNTLERRTPSSKQ